MAKQKQFFLIISTISVNNIKLKKTWHTELYFTHNLVCYQECMYQEIVVNINLSALASFCYFTKIQLPFGQISYGNKGRTRTPARVTANAERGICMKLQLGRTIHAKVFIQIPRSAFASRIGVRPFILTKTFKELYLGLDVWASSRTVSVNKCTSQPATACLACRCS